MKPLNYFTMTKLPNGWSLLDGDAESPSGVVAIVQKEENAKLMSAAPALLEVAERALTTFYAAFQIADAAFKVAPSAENGAKLDSARQNYTDALQAIAFATH